MIKFWFVETLVALPDSWYTEPWFEGVDCYRSLDRAELELDSCLYHYLLLHSSEAAMAAEMARWRQHFGSHAPPMPPGITTCRIMQAKGQDRVVGTLGFNGVFHRHRTAHRERAYWSKLKRTVYLVAIDEFVDASTTSSVSIVDSKREPRREFLSRQKRGLRMDGFVGFRTQKEALEHAPKRSWRKVRLFRVDVTLGEVFRRTTAELEASES
jgi:hypothetical protein